MMPGLDGVDLRRMVRQKDGVSYAYLILLTGKGRKQDIIEGMKPAPMTI